MAWKITLLVAAAGTGSLFTWLGVPVGWLLGAMVAGMAAAALRGGPEAIPVWWQALAQAVIGIYSGTRFPISELRTLGFHLLPLLAAVVLTVGFSLLNGYLLWRWTGIDKATGFMGSLPGAASGMVAMSGELGADPMAVAILQYLRMVIVAFVVPVAVHGLFPAGSGAAALVGATAAGGPALASEPLGLAPDLLLLAAIGAAGALIGRLIRLPSPTFLGPFLAVLIASWTLPVNLYLPDPLFSAGLALMGIAIGGRFNVSMARRLGRVAVVDALLVMGLIGLCLAVGYLFHLATGVSALNAVLGSTPGAMEVMVASSVQMGGDAGLVLAMQIFRWLMILLAGPWVAARLLGRGPAA